MKFDGKTFTHSTLEEGYDFIITDKWKTERHFKISSFPCPGGLLSEALEVVNNKNAEPYIFSILSQFDTDIEYAELQLKAKIKRGIDKKYLKNLQGHLILGEDDELFGRIDWDSNADDGSMILVVDGKRLTKDEFWELLKSYEGWQFRMQIVDRTEE
ncbi:MAG: hypothetical protein ACM31E_04580 [Fibrobacterota bacterium]|jgi:hypothetical protein|nr:hypothetical protein [Chitinispirillaceae bacterium]